MGVFLWKKKVLFIFGSEENPTTLEHESKKNYLMTTTTNWVNKYTIIARNYTIKLREAIFFHLFYL
jgi:hypothetical protein